MQNANRTKINRNLTNQETAWLIITCILCSIGAQIKKNDSDYESIAAYGLLAGVALLVILTSIRGILLDIRQDMANRDEFRQVADFLRTKPELKKPIEDALKEHGYQPPGST